VPSVVDANGISRVIEVPFSDSEQKSFDESANTLRDSLDSLGMD
jgi:L-lactate dehydrogenase